MPTLVFVYNADADVGLAQKLFDAAHKAVSPRTYACSLCKLTHGMLAEKKRWTRFVEQLGASTEVVFLHRDEARRRWPELQPDWPAVLWTRGTGWRTHVLLTAETLNAVQDTAELEGVLALAMANAYGPVSRKPAIGLLGTPGSGKSTVARLLAERGGGVIDADALARAALDEAEVQDQLRAWWGDDIVTPGGAADRARIAEIVFADDEPRRRLEALIHPRVHAGRAELRKQFADDPAVRFIVEDCPLLLETGLEAECDTLVLVDAPRAVRLGRVADRGWDPAELERREAGQLPLDTKRDAADHVLGNGDGLDDLAQQVDRLLETLAPPPSR